MSAFAAAEVIFGPLAMSALRAPSPAARDDGEAAGAPPTSEAFAAFYAETAPALWRYARRVGGSPDVADDVVQESYLRFLRRPCPGSDLDGHRAYLYRIATNLLRDRWRRAERDRRVAPELAASVPPSSTFDRRLDVDAALGRAHPRDRALLWLAYVEGADHREIGEALGLRRASVRVLLFRARRRLARLLERGPEGAP